MGVVGSPCEAVPALSCEFPDPPLPGPPHVFCFVGVLIWVFAAAVVDRDLSSPPGLELHAPAVEVWSLNHGTASITAWNPPRVPGSTVVPPSLNPSPGVMR